MDVRALSSHILRNGILGFCNCASCHLEARYARLLFCDRARIQQKVHDGRRQGRQDEAECQDAERDGKAVQRGREGKGMKQVEYSCIRLCCREVFYNNKLHAIYIHVTYCTWHVFTLLSDLLDLCSPSFRLFGSDCVDRPKRRARQAQGGRRPAAGQLRSLGGRDDAQDRHQGRAAQDPLRSVLHADLRHHAAANVCRRRDRGGESRSREPRVRTFERKVQPGYPSETWCRSL